MTSKLLNLALILGVAWSTSAAADFGNYTSHELRDQQLVIRSDEGELAITAVDDSGFEVHYRETGVTQLPSFALAGPPPQIRTSLTDGDDALHFSTPGLTAVVHKSPIRIEYRYNGDELLAEESGFFRNDEGVGFRFALDAGEKIHLQQLSCGLTTTLDGSQIAAEV